MPIVKAAVLRQVHGSFVIEEIETSDTLLPHEVRVSTHTVGLCHSDLHVVEGLVDRPMPIVLGHEASGVVTEIGSEVTDVCVGDHVVACFVVFCGDCRMCRSGRPAMCQNREATMRSDADQPRLTQHGVEIHQWTNIAGFSEEMILHQNAVTPIDKQMPLDLAAMLGCAVATGIGTASRVAQVKPTDSVVILGCGGVGLNICQGAQLSGAQLIIAVDLNDEKLQLAQNKFGATHVFNPERIPNYQEEIIALTQGGADYVFEAVGSVYLAKLGLELVTRGGMVYAVGVFGDSANIDIPASHLHAGKGVQGVRAGNLVPRRDIPDMVSAYLSGGLELEALVGRRIALTEINDGMNQLRDGSGTRTLVLFD